MTDYELAHLIRNEVDEFRRRGIYMDHIKNEIEKFHANLTKWGTIINNRNRILAHHISYNSDDVDAIRVAYDKVICYANFVIEKYVQSKYAELGIYNFFGDLIANIGPIKIMHVEELDIYKNKIIENTQDLINSVEDLYNNFINFASSVPDGYISRIDWFNYVIFQANNIIDTVYEALKAYIT